jgi:hypothetical protein
LAVRPASAPILWDGIAGAWFWIDSTEEAVFLGIIQRRGGPPSVPNIEDLSRQLTFQALLEPASNVPSRLRLGRRKLPRSSRFPASGFVSIHTGNDFELSIGEQDFLSFFQRIGQGRNAIDTARTRQGQCLIASEIVEVCVDAFHRAFEGLGRCENCSEICAEVALPGTTVT